MAYWSSLLAFMDSGCALRDGNRRAGGVSLQSRLIRLVEQDMCVATELFARTFLCKAFLGGFQNKLFC